MQRLLARTDRLPDYMMTLTYPIEFPGAREAKEHLKTYCQRLERVFKLADKRIAIVWRMELQQRGAVHFHLLLFIPDGVPVQPLAVAASRGKGGSIEDFTRGKALADWVGGGKRAQWAALLAWASVTWHDIVRKWYDPSLWLTESFKAHLRAGVDLKPIRNAAMAISYVSKYIAKLPGEDDDAATATTVGRWWSVRDNSKLLAPKPVLSVTAEEWPMMAEVLEMVAATTGSRWVVSAVADGRLSWFGYVRDDEAARQARLVLDAWQGAQRRQLDSVAGSE